MADPRSLSTLLTSTLLAKIKRQNSRSQNKTLDNSTKKAHVITNENNYLIADLDNSNFSSPFATHTKSWYFSESEERCVTNPTTNN